MQNVPSDLVPIFFSARGLPLFFNADLSSERTTCHELACLGCKNKGYFKTMTPILLELKEELDSEKNLKIISENRAPYPHWIY